MMSSIKKMAPFVIAVLVGFVLWELVVKGLVMKSDTYEIDELNGSSDGEYLKVA